MTINAREWLDRWSQVAGLIPSAKEPADLAGLFQRFRPDGDGVGDLFIGVSKGESVVKRLLSVYAVSAPDFERGQAYFLVAPKDTTHEHAEKLARADLGQLARLLGDDHELQQLLGGVSISWHDRVDSIEGPQGDDDPAVWIYDSVFDRLGAAVDPESPLSLLRDAAYSIANDLYLAAFVLWPLYEDRISLPDPFRAHFDLWSAGLRLRFLDEERCIVGS